jgi:hypothetical protein
MYEAMAWLLQQKDKQSLAQLARHVPSWNLLPRPECAHIHTVSPRPSAALSHSSGPQGGLSMFRSSMMHQGVQRSQDTMQLFVQIGPPKGARSREREVDLPGGERLRMPEYTIDHPNSANVQVRPTPAFGFCARPPLLALGAALCLPCQ